MSEALRKTHARLLSQVGPLRESNEADYYGGAAMEPLDLLEEALGALLLAIQCLEAQKDRPWMVVLKPHLVSDFRVVGPFTTATDAQAFAERFVGRSAFEVRLDKPEDYTT